MAKEGIASFEQFLLLQQCFQMSSAADAPTSGKRLISLDFESVYAKIWKISKN